MDKLIEGIPAIITSAAQSYLGILALLSIALSVLAYFFFAKSAVKVRVWIFVLLFLGVCGFGAAMFRVADDTVNSPPSTARNAELSQEAKILLATAAKDPAGLVLFERFGTSVDLHSNGNSLFTDKGDHQTLVTWESALDELTQQGLLVALGDRREMFEITKQGYDVAKGFDVMESE
jgi:hypothetical protein